MKLRDVLIPLIAFVQDKTVNTIFVDLLDGMRILAIPIVTNLTPTEIVQFICREDLFASKILNESIYKILVRGIAVSEDCLQRNIPPDNWGTAAVTREGIIVLNLTSDEFLK